VDKLVFIYKIKVPYLSDFKMMVSWLAIVTAVLSSNLLSGGFSGFSHFDNLIPPKIFFLSFSFRTQESIEDQGLPTDCSSHAHLNDL